MIAIVDAYGANIASIQFALQRLGKKSIATSDKNIIKSATHVILPGVRTAQYAMTQLNKLNLITTLTQLQQPVLGICLGMQLFFEYSAEGNVACLNLLPGEIKKLSVNDALAIPHMGWNQITLCNNQSSLMHGIVTKSYVYFVHSYATAINEYTTAMTHYGSHFASAIENKNFYGVQFHPERSGKIGERILRNFVAL